MAQTFEYLIEDRWFVVPGSYKIPHTTSRPVSTPHRTIVQVVKPPRGREHETTIMLREAWEHGEYFPTIWIARPDIYKKPHILIVGEQLVAVKATHVCQHQNFVAARYVAVLGLEQNRPEVFAFARKEHIPGNTRILGVFERCDSP